MDTNTLVEKYEQEMIGVRRTIHQHPELSNKEFETTKRIEKFLRDCGIEVLEVGMKTGCIGLLKGGKPGKVVGLREDIDALPIVEQTGLPFASCEEGVMHACDDVNENPGTRVPPKFMGREPGKIGPKLGWNWAEKIPQKYPVYIMHGVFIFMQNRKT